MKMAIIDQTRWSYKGIKATNEAAFIIEDYALKKMLNEMGYRLNYEDLEQWEVSAYSLIHETISQEEKRKR